MRVWTFPFIALFTLPLSSPSAAMSPGRLLSEINLDDPPPAAGGAASASPAAPVEADGTAPAPAPTKSAAVRRKEALTAFEIGETDVALETMKELLRECLALSETECKPATRAVLYRDVGIILADGKGDHAAAVRAMRGALRANQNITIPDDYRSTKVTAAFDEARRQDSGYAPARPLAPVERTSTAAASAAGFGEGHRDKPLLVHVAGTVKAGTYSANGTGIGLGVVGPEVALAYVAPGGLLVGGLGHVDYKWPLDFPSAEVGTWGLAAIVGGAFGRSTPKVFQYAFGGVGFEHWPTSGTFGFAVQGRYGVSLDGLGIGVGFDTFYTPVPFYYGTTTMALEALFGFHIGFADLVGSRRAAAQ